MRASMKCLPQKYNQFCQRRQVEGGSLKQLAKENHDQKLHFRYSEKRLANSEKLYDVVALRGIRNHDSIAWHTLGSILSDLMLRHENIHLGGGPGNDRS